MTTHVIPVLTANDRLKQRFDGMLAVSLVLAAALHVLLSELFPEMSAVSWSIPAEEIIDVVRIEDIELPADPEELSRPSMPVISVDAPLEQTLPTIRFDEYVKLPPPPDAGSEVADGNGTPFTPYTVAPELLNARELRCALERAYPPALRDAGLGATVSMLINIDEEGKILGARIGEPAAYAAFDRAALSLVDVMRFRPAMNRDRYVAVWIALPLTFQVR